MNNLSPKTKLYIAIGFGVLALILVVVIILMHLGGADPTPAVTAAGVAGATAAAAAASRGKAQQQVTDAQEQNKRTAGDIIADKDKADADMKAAKTDVSNMSHDAKEKAGEDMFKPGGGT